MYIHIRIHICISNNNDNTNNSNSNSNNDPSQNDSSNNSNDSCGSWSVLRPISLLTLSLLTLLESNFPGKSLGNPYEFHPFKLRLCWSQTLGNPQY